MSWVSSPPVFPLALPLLADRHFDTPTEDGVAILTCLAKAVGAVALMGLVRRPGSIDSFVRSDAIEGASNLHALNEHHDRALSFGTPRWSWKDFDSQSFKLLVKAEAGNDGSIVTAGFCFDCEHDAELAMKSAAEHEGLVFAAIACSAQCREQAARLRACHDTMNAVDFGVVHLDAKGAITFENNAASTMLDASAAILRHGGALKAANLADAVRLRMAIEHNADRAEGVRVAPIVQLRRAKHARPIFAVVVASDWQEHGPGVAVTVYLVDPDRDVTTLISAACRMYGLTPVERELTAKIVAGLSLAEAALVLKIKEGTARTYLKSIFRKTGVKRQAALVTLIMASMINLNRAIPLAAI